MKQLLLDAFWHVTSELSVKVVPAIGVEPSAANLEETAAGEPAYASARIARHNSGPTLR